MNLIVDANSLATIGRPSRLANDAHREICGGSSEFQEPETA
jgi:hypothetical protein